MLVLQPAANQVGIEAMGQRHSGHRGAGCWQSEMTWRLRSGAWRRRVRFVGVLCMVSTYLLGGHYPHASGLGSQDAFTGRIRLSSLKTTTYEHHLRIDTVADIVKQIGTW
jgi:hypothetical protein